MALFAINIGIHNLTMSEADQIWIPYEQRKEWEDITPVPQNDGPQPVCAIAYDDKCRSRKFKDIKLLLTH